MSIASSSTSSADPRLFWLAVATIVCAFASVLWVIRKDRETTLPLASYRVAFFSLCFALGTTSALIFASTVADMHYSSGSSIAISIAGPGALWIAAVVLLSWLYPESRLQEEKRAAELQSRNLGMSKLEAEITKVREQYEQRIADLSKKLEAAYSHSLLTQLIHETEKNDGWIRFPDWLTHLGEAVSVIDEEHEHFINEMLPRVLFHGDPAKNRLTDPFVDTLFMYTKTGAVKFQRITGSTVRNLGADVYLAATPSKPSSNTSTFAFVKQETKIIRADRATHGEWWLINGNPIDCLVVTLFGESSLSEGDWLYVDLTKYLAFSDDAPGRIRLGYVVDENVRLPSTWAMSVSKLNRIRPTPLIFKRMEPIEMPLEEQLEAFRPWFRALDTPDNWQANCKNAQTRSFLERVARELSGQTSKPTSIESLVLTSGANRGHNCYQLTNLQHGVIHVFRTR